MSEIDHLGIAVKSLAEARKFYEKLGLKSMPEETVEAEKVRLAMVPLGESRIELLEPLSDDSTIAKFLAKRGEGLHHVALHVDDLVRHGRTVEGQRNASHLRRNQDWRRRTFVRLRSSLQHRRRAAGTGGRRSPGRLRMLVIAIDTSGRKGSVALCRGDADSFEVLQLTSLEGGNLFGATDAGNFPRAR